MSTLPLKMWEYNVILLFCWWLCFKWIEWMNINMFRYDIKTSFADVCNISNGILGLFSKTISHLIFWIISNAVLFLLGIWVVLLGWMYFSKFDYYSCRNINTVLFLQKGDTPLIMATKKGMIDIATLLVDRGADSSSKSKVKTRRSE